MKILLSVCMVGALVFISTVTSYAGMANGTYSVDLGAEVPLWDLSGYYNSDVGIGGLEITITHNPSGTFTGSGDLYISDLGISLDLTAVASGKSTGSSKDPKVSMKVLATDSNDDHGSYYINYLIAAMSLAMQVDSADSELGGKGSGSVKYSIANKSTGKAAKGSKSGATGSIVFPLPGDVTGDWNLTLKLNPTGIKYAGTARVVTAAGDTVDFTATGTYSAPKDTSILTLKGTGAGAGTTLSLSVSTSGSTISVKSLKGKMFGQTLSYSAP